tara:strand:- start:55 stop:888 length:834 start_codon:yes stop_codon:yes gene_type:complete
VTELSPIFKKEDLIKFKENGFVLVENFLNEKELNKATKIVKKYCKEKNRRENLFSINLKTLFYKILKLKLNRFFDDIEIKKIANQKQMENFSEQYFNNKTRLSMIDGYISKKNINADITPWHTDRAYVDKYGTKDIKVYNHHDHYNIKFFIYLTDVEKQNGCLSYIPKSNLIGYLIRKGIYSGNLNYSPYWSLDQFRKFTSVKKNYNYIKSNLKDKNVIDDFLKKTENLKDNVISDYDYSAKRGDVIIFDEGGIHRGASATKNDRIVLRYFYENNYN